MYRSQFLGQVGGHYAGHSACWTGQVSPGDLEHILLVHRKEGPDEGEDRMLGFVLIVDSAQFPYLSTYSSRPPLGGSPL